MASRILTVVPPSLGHESSGFGKTALPVLIGKPA